MESKQEFISGLLSENNFKDSNYDIGTATFKYIMWIPAVTSFILLCLGLCKAIFGCCFEKLDKWKFDYTQSYKSYGEAGRAWRFLINIFLLILLPFVVCTKCFTLNIRNNEQIDSENEDDHVGENTSLLQFQSTQNMFTISTIEKNNYSSETLFDTRSLRNAFEDEETLAKDTEFVIKAMNESHESLNKFHHETSSIDEKSEVKEVVENLLNARIVYRKFSNPIGGVKMKSDQKFSIRGYFLPSRDHGYQFITYSPLKQVYEISNDSLLVPTAPQILLDSKAFRKYYENKSDVFNAGDLTLQPSLSSPCINIVVQDRSMYSSN